MKRVAWWHGCWMALAVVALPIPSSPAAAATVVGRFEGSNVVDITEVSPNNFTCKLTSPPRPYMESIFYSNGSHYHNWFMLRVDNAMGQPVTVTITNADYGGSNFWRNNVVFTNAPDPFALSSEATWQLLPSGSMSGSAFTFTITPTADRVWVAMAYPAMPSHTNNWVAFYSSNPYVSVTTSATTSRGRPLQVLRVTDPGLPLSGKKGIMITGQVHSNEQSGGWATEGLVEFLVSSDAVAQTLRQKTVFIVVPDSSPDATASGTCFDPDDGKGVYGRHNPAWAKRMMTWWLNDFEPMTVEGKGLWDYVSWFVASGGTIDVGMDVHCGYLENYVEVYDLTDQRAVNFNSKVASYMTGYTTRSPVGYDTQMSSRSLPGRSWEEWRALMLGYEISPGSGASFLSLPQHKYFGEALARGTYNYFGGFAEALTVTSPNGGEVLASGATVVVTWTSLGSVANVRIDFSADGGSSWTNLTASAPNNGSASVILPAVNSTSCLIRVSDALAFGVSDVSDGPLTVGIPPVGTITVNAPNGGENWYTDSAATVAWSSTGSASNVWIELSTDNGANWSRLAWSVPASNGSYLVNVPGTPSNQCLVRVNAVENSSISDTTDSVFSILPAPSLPTLTITSPNGGETWPAGGTATVTWTTTGVVATIGIGLSTDEGASWTTLVDSINNTGSAVVNVPNTESSRCLVWIYDARRDSNAIDADPLDVSDNLFTISTSVDGGSDAGQDAGTDTGEDAGTDAGNDAGTDTGMDAMPDEGGDQGKPGGDTGSISGSCGCGEGSGTAIPFLLLLLAGTARRSAGRRSR